jgi:ribosomal protein S18 acetylase RimI-like enzyme
MVSIRKAEHADCSGIARVQVDSYRSAYAPFFPPGYLDNFSYEEQTQDWIEWLATRPDDILLVALSREGSVIGYALARAARDIYPGYDAEILALHVAAAAQRQGLGSMLLREAAAALAGRGCLSAMLWTVAGNPARAWYERLGGQLIGEKSYDVDGWMVTEVAYGWPQIDGLRTSVAPEVAA